MMDATSHKHSHALSSANSFSEQNIPALPNAEPLLSSVFMTCGPITVAVLIRPLFISALSDGQSNSLLNGNFVVAMFKREINFKGAIIEYSGSDTKVERINCTERIEEELILQV